MSGHWKCQKTKRRTFFLSAHVWTLNKSIHIDKSFTMEFFFKTFHSFFIKDPRRSDMKFCLIVLCLPLIVSGFGLKGGGFHFPKSDLIRYHFCMQKKKYSKSLIIRVTGSIKSSIKNIPVLDFNFIKIIMVWRGFIYKESG